MFIPSRLSILLGSAALVALPGLTMAADVTAVEFSSTPAPATDEAMLRPVTSSVAKVTYADGTTRDFPLSYNVIFKNTDAFDGKAAGQLYDVKGEPIKDPNGDLVIAETPDANSLLSVDGKPFLVTHYEYDWILGNGEEGRKAEGWHGRMPMSMTVAALAQGEDGKLTPTSVKPIDFSSVDGLWIPCAGGPTPWGTHLGSEEDYDLYFTVASGEKELKKTTAGVKALSEVYFRGEKQANPYAYGFIPEVTVKGDGSAAVVKHYSMGRATWELARVMPDNRTAYYGDDGTNVGLFMYVADAEKDLSAGTLYAAKWTQTSADNGGAADITWIKLGHATDAEVKALIDKGITFDDIFESKAPPAPVEEKTAEAAAPPAAAPAAAPAGEAPKAEAEAAADAAAPDHAAEGFTRIRAGHGGDEWLKLKPGMEQAAAFLEPRRYAAMLGATTEFNKMEGVAADDRKKNLYVAMSYIEKGMTKDETGPRDDIQVAKLKAGAVYELPMAGGQKDQNGEAINSDWVGTKMAVPAALLGVDIEADALGNVADPTKIANPDNLFFSPKMRTLFVGEDSGTHVNNAVWAWNVDTGALASILWQPSGAEATGLQVVDDMNGHAYIMANNQHQGEWIESMPEEVSKRLEDLARTSFGSNDKGTAKFMLEANVGYLGGLPGL